MEKLETGKLIGMRIDKVIHGYIKEAFESEVKDSDLLSRSFAEEVVPTVVTINGRDVKKSHKIKATDIVEVNVDALRRALELKMEQFNLLDEIEGEKGELEIIEENDAYLIVNKPHGVVVHPGHNNRTGTLANFVKYYLEKKGEYDPMLERAGIVHRLDKSVGGLMLFAKNRRSQLYYKKLFETHQILKVYRCEVESIEDKSFKRDVSKILKAGGNFDKEEVLSKLSEAFMSGAEKTYEGWIRVEGYISRDRINRIKMIFTRTLPNTSDFKARHAISNIFPLGESDFLINIETGRMHQIRATLKSLGYVVKGDELYKKGEWADIKRIELESILLGFINEEGEFMKYVL